MVQIFRRKFTAQPFLKYLQMLVSIIIVPSKLESCFRISVEASTEVVPSQKNCESSIIKFNF